MRPDHSASLLTIREDFAAMMMAALLSNRDGGACYSAPEAVADLAVAYADALVARLSGATRATPSRLKEGEVP